MKQIRRRVIYLLILALCSVLGWQNINAMEDEPWWEETRESEQTYIKMHRDIAYTLSREAGQAIERVNEEALSDAAGRIIENGFGDPARRIFHLRSLRQVNGWLCGYFVLYNAYLVNRIIRDDKCNLVKSALCMSDSYQRDFFTHDKFKEFYRTVVYAHYRGNLTQNDIRTGLPVRDREDAFRNFLSDDELININKRARGQFYVIGEGIVRGSNDTYMFSDEDVEELIKRQFDKKRGPCVYSFACHAGNHWVLISLVKQEGDPVPALIVMDSANEDSLEDEARAAVIRASIDRLHRIFVQPEMEKKPAKEEKARRQRLEQQKTKKRARKEEARRKDWLVPKKESWAIEEKEEKTEELKEHRVESVYRSHARGVLEQVASAVGMSLEGLAGNANKTVDQLIDDYMGKSSTSQPEKEEKIKESDIQREEAQLEIERRAKEEEAQLERERRARKKEARRRRREKRARKEEEARIEIERRAREEEEARERRLERDREGYAQEGRVEAHDLIDVEAAAREAGVSVEDYLKLLR